MKFFTEKSKTPSKEKVLDIKELLKLARQYIDDKNIKKAQQCCRKVLRKNNQNYMALVLLGKSYGKSDDAFSSYEKAIELKPNNPLAWQGLAHYYEVKENESTKMKLLRIYDKILTLNIEEDYAHKTLLKLGQLGSLLKHNDIITSFLQYIRVQENIKLKETAKMQVLQLLLSNITCKNEDIPDIINILQNINDDTLNDMELILLGKLILQSNDFIAGVEKIIALEKFPGSTVLKTWLCKLLCDTFVKYNSFGGFDIDNYIHKIVMGIENTIHGGTLIAITYYRCSMFEEAYRKCISVTKEHLDNIQETEALFLINCSKMTSNKIRTKNLCNYFLRKDQLNTSNFIVTVNSVLLSSYMEEKDFYKALECLKNIPIGKIDSIVLTKLGNFFLEFDLVRDFTREILNSTDYLELFTAFALIRNKKFTEAIKVLLLFDKHPIKYYYLALAYWFVNQNEESLENFQKAANLIPNHPIIYYCLGIHYYCRNGDIEESKKCFEKSYALCKTDINVIKMLSIVYERLNLIDLEFELLQTAFDIPQTRAFWVCTRLGHICYSKGITEDALVYLQAAIDFHPEDVTAQELIGDIYFSKKDYDRALVAYNRVIDFSQDNVALFKCLNRIGCIYSEQGLYHKAIYIFDNILDNDPSNVIALKGITENRIIFALKHVASELYHDAREQLQFAINHITTAMSMGIKDLIYWLLYGDVLVFLTRLPNEHSFVILQTSEGETRREKIDMYKMAIESYSNLIKFRDSTALFRSALVYFEYYCETKNVDLCKTSYNLAVLYIKVNSNVWLMWDMLGKICYQLDKYETANYCFSKALSLSEENEFKSWCDLGVLYLKLDKHQLSNYKHVIEQYDLATFAPLWVKDNVSDAFLNCNDNLEIDDVDPLNIEGVDELDFSEWILTYHPTPVEHTEPIFDSPIESFKNFPNSTDVIEWYLCFEEESAWSCYSLGSIQEDKGLFIPALRYYDRAYEIAHDTLKNEILSHKGRVLMKMFEYEEAANVYNKISEKNIQDTCALAFALYKIENYKKSYAAYNKALCDLCENDYQRVDVLIAMSNVAHRLNGLYDGAMRLLQAVKIICGEDEDFNIPFMKIYVFKKVDIQLVAFVMTEFLFKDIDKATWWYYMGLNYLRRINRNAKLTRACIKRAIRENTVPRRIGKLHALISVAEYYSGNRQKALNSTTRALKLYPVQPELWAIFILCIYTDKTWPRKASFLRIVIDTVRKFVNISESMERWLSKVEEETTGQIKNFDFTFVPNLLSP